MTPTGGLSLEGGGGLYIAVEAVEEISECKIFWCSGNWAPAGGSQ